jgi:superfamily I DNA/RNA helicase
MIDMDTNDMDRFISASAGTGKTHTISKTYVDLFEQALQNEEPLSVANVVAITFTRKAASELKNRILEMIRSRDDDLAWQKLRSTMAFAWISTIDSFAQRILSEVGIYAKVNPDLKIGSASIMGDILKRCIARLYFEQEDLLRPLLEFYTLDGITVILIKRNVSSWPRTLSRSSSIWFMDRSWKGCKKRTSSISPAFSSLSKIFYPQQNLPGFVRNTASSFRIS